MSESAASTNGLAARLANLRLSKSTFAWEESSTSEDRDEDESEVRKRCAADIEDELLWGNVLRKERDGSRERSLADSPADGTLAASQTLQQSSRLTRVVSLDGRSYRGTTRISAARSTGRLLDLQENVERVSVRRITGYRGGSVADNGGSDDSRDTGRRSSPVVAGAANLLRIRDANGGRLPQYDDNAIDLTLGEMPPGESARSASTAMLSRPQAQRTRLRPYQPIHSQRAGFSSSSAMDDENAWMPLAAWPTAAVTDRVTFGSNGSDIFETTTSAGTSACMGPSGRTETCSSFTSSMGPASTSLAINTTFQSLPSVDPYDVASDQGYLAPACPEEHIPETRLSPTAPAAPRKNGRRPAQPLCGQAEDALVAPRNFAEE